MGHFALLSLGGKRLLGLLTFPNLFKYQDIEGGDASPDHLDLLNDSQRILNDAILAQLAPESRPKGAAFDRNLKEGIATDLLEDLMLQVVRGEMEPEINWEFRDLFYYPEASQDIRTLLTRDNGARPCVRLSPNKSSFEFLNSKMFAFFLKNMEQTLTELHEKFRGYVIPI
jgi:hypothetical protein